MKSTFQIQRPEDIEVTMTTTMTLKQWCQVQAELRGGNHASSVFSKSIRDVVTMAESKFTAVHPEASTE